MRAILLSIVAFVFLSWGAFPKKQQIKLDTKKIVKDVTRTKYLTKFDIGRGNGLFRIRVRKLSQKKNQTQIQGKVSPRIGLLKDTYYDEFISKETCEEKTKLYNRTVGLDYGSFSAKDIKLDIEEDLSEDYWYIFVFDCITPVEEYQTKYLQPLTFQIKMLNNGSNLGQNQNLIPEYIFLVILWAIFFVIYISPILNSLKQTGLNGKVIIYFGFLVLIISYLYRLINLFTIYYFDQRIDILNSIAEIIRHVIQGILVGVMISIAYGYSILTFRLDRISLFLGFYMCIGNIICSLYDVEDSPDMHHHYDKMTFPVIIALRAGMLLSFLCGVRKTLSSSAGKIKLFMKKYAVWGSLYLLGWPIGFVICETILPKQKHHEFLILIQESLHVIGNAMMCHSFTIATSQFKKVDKQNQPLLPG